MRAACSNVGAVCSSPAERQVGEPARGELLLDEPGADRREPLRSEAARMAVTCLAATRAVLDEVSCLAVLRLTGADRDARHGRPRVRVVGFCSRSAPPEVPVESRRAPFSAAPSGRSLSARRTLLPHVGLATVARGRSIARAARGSPRDERGRACSRGGTRRGSSRKIASTARRSQPSSRRSVRESTAPGRSSSSAADGRPFTLSSASGARGQAPSRAT